MEMRTNDYINVNKEAYDKLSQEYKTRGEIKSGHEETPEYLVNNILKFNLNNKPLSILEIGPGSGEIVSFFEDLGHRTIAVELSEKISIIAKNKSPNSIIINSNILELEFVNDQFDIIYAGALIHLFPKADATMLLEKISKWLKPQGLLFINTTICEKSEEGFYTKSDYYGEVIRFRNRWTETDFEKFIKEMFCILKTLYTNEIDRKKTWVGYICQTI